MAKGLTRKQQVFVAEYLVDLNATRAAIAAGYSKRTAAKQAHQLLEIPRIAEKVAQKTGKRLEKLEITADRVLQELAKLAFFKVTDALDADGRFKPLSELDDTTAAAIAGFKTVSKVTGEDEDGMVVFTDMKFADKGQNLERLGKHLKLFTDKLEIDATDEVIAKLAAARKRGGK
ncbi:MAG: terminase small subunit [Patescibacteria group bacterium]|nr:terminase small subunit [Patescibacteria group bacterium]